MEQAVGPLHISWRSYPGALPQAAMGRTFGANVYDFQRGPKARHHTSPGQRPGVTTSQSYVRAKGPFYFALYRRTNDYRSGRWPSAYFLGCYPGAPPQAAIGRTFGAKSVLYEREAQGSTPSQPWALCGLSQYTFVVSQLFCFR